MSRVKKIAVMLAMVGAIGLVSSACVVTVDEPAAPAVSTSYYTPLYYNGYIVYYDASGLPYYYYGGRIMYVPRPYHLYNRYVGYYARHRSYYRRWYTARGRHARYRRYNRRRYRRARNRRGVRRNTRRRTKRKVRHKKRRGRF